MKAHRKRGHGREIASSEQGAIRKEWGGRIPIALVYPNRYATGMSNLGFQFVYHLLNQEPDVVCERAFLPEAPEGEYLDKAIPALTVESRQPLRRFEILAFSMPFENDYAHVLALLASSGIPLEASRRHPPHPLVLVGGITTSLDPEPLAPFVDLFAIGEAEELLSDLLKTYRQCRNERRTKGECLEALSQVPGIYVPSLYEVRYDKLGRIRSFKSRGSAPSRVLRRMARDLSGTIPASKISTSSTAFESLFLIEIGRGCSRRCRFCAAGHVFRPTRYRGLENLLPAIGEGLKQGKRIGLVSSSVCDHPEIDEICEAILSSGGKVSVSSLRLDALGDNLLKALAGSGHRTLSLAPEAGSQRLRDVIRKGISEDQILDAVARIVAAGIPVLRMYFMVGLPKERWEDVEAIGTLARKVLHRARKVTEGRGLERLTLSVNPFVPKPSTPFQWHPFMEVNELKARIQHLRRSLRKDRSIQVLYEPPKWARIQALLARGDRRVGRVLMLVARGRSWDEALREVNLNPAFYLNRRREYEEQFPWDFIDQGFSKSSLWESYQKALAV